MNIVVDRGKWEVSRNRLPPRHHNSDKQTAIREHSLHLYVPLDYSNELVLPWDFKAQALISNVVWQV
jgi:hypothetical protein